MLLFLLFSCWENKELTTEKNMDNWVIINEQKVYSINVKDFKEKLNDDYILIDIRTSWEISEWFISWLDLKIDYYSPDIKEQINGLDKNKKYLIYCRTWSRSWSLLYYMKEVWFKEAYDLEGGIFAWSRAWWEIKK